MKPFRVPSSANADVAVQSVTDTSAAAVILANLKSNPLVSEEEDNKTEAIGGY
jgi:hypothetical protein